MEPGKPGMRMVSWNMNGPIKMEPPMEPGEDGIRMVRLNMKRTYEDGKRDGSWYQK